MYAGEVVEQGPVRSLFARPRHPYTLALLECLPAASSAAPAARLLPAIEGFLPGPDRRAAGRASSRLAARMAAARCREERPGWSAAASSATSRCFFADAVPAAGRRTGPAGAARPAGPPPAPGRPCWRRRTWSTSTGAGGWLAGSGAGAGPGAGRRLTSRGGRARRWPSSGRAARGRRRSGAAWSGSSSRRRAAPAGRPALPAPAGRAGRAPCGADSRWSSRIPTARSTPAGRSSTRWRGRSSSSAWPDRRTRRARRRGAARAVGLGERHSTSSRARSAAASASAWLSPVPSRAARIWSSATSPPRRSTSRSRRRC